MTTPETTRKNRIREKVQALGCEYHALVNLSENFWPDAVILVPGGHAIFIEAKKDGARKDARYIKQAETLRRLSELGFECFMVDNFFAETLLFRMIEVLLASPR